MKYHTHWHGQGDFLVNKSHLLSKKHKDETGFIRHSRQTGEYSNWLEANNLNDVNASQRIFIVESEIR